MAAVLVVADDLTGANAAAAGFAHAGLRAVTAGAVDRPAVVTEMAARFDVVVASTDGRHSTAADAATRVRSVVQAGWPVRLVCNRIDTTLRGNLGATTAAVLTEVRDLVGPRVAALCAPAHPAADRHTIEGRQLLGGRRLEETEVARDPRTPIQTSDVAARLAEQADLVTERIPLSVVTGDAAALVAAMTEALRRQADVLVVDATTQEHLDRVAEAAAAAGEAEQLTWVTVDPGPASVAMAKALGIRGHSGGAPLLAVSGSATELTRSQLQQLAAEPHVRIHRVPTRQGGPIPDVDATTALLDRALADAAANEVVVLATVVDASDLVDVTSEDARLIPRALAHAVRRALETHPVDGLFSTGGDVTAAMLSELGSHGLEVAGEVIPLAVAGAVVGGPWDGLPVVTKGGLIGDAGTTRTCIEHLRRAADLHRSQVAAAQSRTRFEENPTPSRKALS